MGENPHHLKLWWQNVTPWESFLRDVQNLTEDQIINLKVERIQNAAKLFDLLMTDHYSRLTCFSEQLKRIAFHLDQESKKSNGPITMKVIGGIAVGAGIIFAPFTFGVSLLITVMGVSLAAAGGVTGNQVTSAKKEALESDKNTAMKLFQDFLDFMRDIESCLIFIGDGANLLAAQHQMTSLFHVKPGQVRPRSLAQLGERPCPSAVRAIQRVMVAVQAQAQGLPMYIKNAKGRLKSLARVLRGVALQVEYMQAELQRTKELLGEATSPAP